MREKRRNFPRRTGETRLSAAPDMRDPLRRTARRVTDRRRKRAAPLFTACARRRGEGQGKAGSPVTVPVRDRKKTAGAKAARLLNAQDAQQAPLNVRPVFFLSQRQAKKKPRFRGFHHAGGAQRETRTPTPIGTATSRQRVYQFHHLGTGSLLQKSAALGKHFFRIFRISLILPPPFPFRPERRPASFFCLTRPGKTPNVFRTGNRAAAAPPTPPGPKGSNGNGCCRVSGSSKGAARAAPFP